MVRIDHGQESTYCALKSKLEPGAAVQAVLDSSITGCEIAQLSLADQTGNTQYTLISPTIIDTTVEGLFNGELVQREDISYLQTIYLCDNCSEIFQTSQACSRHITQCRKRKSAEPDDEQPHKKKPNQKKAYCDQCKKSYSSGSALWLHKKSVHEPKQYDCPVCEKLFKQAVHLKNHIKNVHNGERYTCDSCGKAYSSMTSLRTHQESDHKGIRYPCPECGRLFKQAGHMRRHQQRVHKVI